MQKLLNIPQSYYVYLGEAEQPLAYGFIGKGVDLQGVLHEWGAQSIEAMLNLVAGTIHTLALEQVIMIAPMTLPSAWQENIEAHCEKTELQTMALAKSLGAFDTRCLHDLFIWGLDSI